MAREEEPWTCFLPSPLQVCASTARMGLHFPTSLWEAVPWHRRDLMGKREGGRETTASRVLVAFCSKDAEFQSQLFLFFICVREPCDVKQITSKERALGPNTLAWVMYFLLMHPLPPLFAAQFTQKLPGFPEELPPALPAVLWHTGVHSHTCRSTVSLLGCPSVLREGHADLSPLTVKKRHVWMC